MRSLRGSFGLGDVAPRKASKANKAVKRAWRTWRRNGGTESLRAFARLMTGPAFIAWRSAKGVKR